MAHLGLTRRACFVGCVKGSVAVQTALLMLLVLAFIALGVEASQLLLEHRKQQTVADSAAMAAASAVKLGVTDLQAEARAVAAQLGYSNGVGGVTVTAVKPPTSGPHLGDVKYVEVKVGRTVTPGLMQLFRPGPVTVSARAVASVGTAGSTVCALLLEPSASEALKLDNTGKLTLPSCAIKVNSTSNTAILMYNNSKINGDVNVGGNVSNQNNSSITGTITKGAAATADPYASRVLPSPGSVQPVPNPSSGNASIILYPGIHGSGWNFWGSQNVLLNSGVYFVRGDIGLSGNVTMTGTGVTIVIDGNYKINLNGSSVLSLTAITTGNTAGIAVYSKATQDQQFTNSTGINIVGAMYFPNQKIEFNSSASNNSASSCTQLVAKKLYLTNSVDVVLRGSCDGVGTSSLGASGPSALAE